VLILNGSRELTKGPISVVSAFSKRRGLVLGDKSGRGTLRSNTRGYDNTAWRMVRVKKGGGRRKTGASLDVRKKAATEGSSKHAVYEK